MNVAGGVSQSLLKWFVGFRTSICKMESLAIEKMQTLQVAFSITFRISPLLLHPALLMPVEVLPWISNLIRPEDCDPFILWAVKMLMTLHRVCRHCDGGWAWCHIWWELCPEVLTVSSLDVEQWVGVTSKSEEWAEWRSWQWDQGCCDLAGEYPDAALIKYWVTNCRLEGRRETLEGCGCWGTWRASTRRTVHAQRTRIACPLL